MCRALRLSSAPEISANQEAQQNCGGTRPNPFGDRDAAGGLRLRRTFGSGLRFRGGIGNVARGILRMGSGRWARLSRDRLTRRTDFGKLVTIEWNFRRLR